ncbi:MAG: RHS repeat-associated core domain-containing protein, partial [Deltaproteobacteria bacterium]|nr:RHS repeat-associated core domain-containing protein [Deltaproteobacteria bacterium]
SVNGGTPIAFSYDDDGLLTQAGALVLTRDATNGFVTGTTLGNVTDAFGYNGHGEVTAYNAQFLGTTMFAEGFERDNLGRITTKTETVVGETHVYQYEYHVRGWLTDVWTDGVHTSHYEYDANGNRLAHTKADGTVVTADYDDQDRMLRNGTTNYTWTNNGEMQTRTETLSGAVTTYSWDEFGNLVEVVLPDGTDITYVIDARNRRVGKRVNGTLVQGFLYEDQLRIAAEFDGAGNVTRPFVYALSPNSPEMIPTSSWTWRVFKDHLGSPRLVVDEGSGAVVARMDYDAFGVVTAETGAGAVPHGFAGGLYDRDTELVRFGARDYDAASGRWTAKEPLRFTAALNFYEYAGNDPVNRADATGLADAATMTQVAQIVALLVSGAAAVSGGVVALAVAALPVAAVGLVIVGAFAAGVGIGVLVAHFGELAVEEAMAVDTVSTATVCEEENEEEKVEECAKKSAGVMALCLSQGKSTAVCSRAYDITFARCMHYPIPPESPLPN